jgi:hypothetical protein
MSDELLRRRNLQEQGKRAAFGGQEDDNAV